MHVFEMVTPCSSIDEFRSCKFEGRLVVAVDKDKEEVGKEVVKGREEVTALSSE